MATIQSQINILAARTITNTNDLKTKGISISYDAESTTFKDSATAFSIELGYTSYDCMLVIMGSSSVFNCYVMTYKGDVYYPTDIKIGSENVTINDIKSVTKIVVNEKKTASNILETTEGTTDNTLTITLNNDSLEDDKSTDLGTYESVRIIDNTTVYSNISNITSSKQVGFI